MNKSLKKLIRWGYRPEGFVVAEGRVQWANGRQYTETGNNPGRTESYWLSGQHGLLCSYFFEEEARPATVEEAEAHLKRVRAYLQEQRDFTTREYNKRMAEIDATERAYKDRLKAHREAMR